MENFRCLDIKLRYGGARSKRNLTCLAVNRGLLDLERAFVEALLLSRSEFQIDLVRVESALLTEFDFLFYDLR